MAFLRTRWTSTLASLALLSFSASAGTPLRVLTTEIAVDAPIEKAWAAWTTEDGVKSFFAAGCIVEPRVDGRYEIWFLPGNPPGQRGAEGTRILSIEPMRRFVFTWDAPPTLPDIRSQRTVVILDFERRGDAATLVRFTHLGWGEGSDWDKAYDYFDTAWRTRVLPRFRHVMEHGPVDWAKLPELAPVTPSMKAALTKR